MSLLNKFLRDDSGVTAIEYGLIAALIAVVAITALRLLGTNVSTGFNTVATTVGASNTVANGGCNGG